MRIHLNPGNAGFASVRKGVYVDKSGMIELVNKALGTSRKMICISRPRRFGKSFAAQMLCAYYDRTVDSSALFDDLEIAKKPDYQTFRSQFDVFYFDMAGMLSTLPSPDGYVQALQSAITDELQQQWPQITAPAPGEALLSACQITGRRFLFIIDEWDAVFREAKENRRLQEDYVRFLRGLFKNGNLTERTIEGCYMTGILPIKKYGTQSALTDFHEYTMVSPEEYAPYFGFTEKETQELCERYGMPYGEVKRWYDGYELYGGIRLFNPKSVMDCVSRGRIENYWTQSESFESLKIYIDMDFDGLKQALVCMLGGGSVFIETVSFQNDMTSIHCRDDVLTLLVHLGYLSYRDGEVSIPNEEIRQEFARAVRANGHSGIARLAKLSDQILQDTIEENEAAVASAIARVHDEGTAVFQYNDEQALRSVVKFAYISCMDEYARMEELPSGRGFADIIYIPKRTSALPALVIELKWNRPAEGAIAQIRRNQYPSVLKDFADEILLVGISYDVKTRQHTCRIEEA